MTCENEYEEKMKQRWERVRREVVVVVEGNKESSWKKEGIFLNMEEDKE